MLLPFERIVEKLWKCGKTRVNLWKKPWKSRKWWKSEGKQLTVFARKRIVGIVEGKRILEN